MSELAMFAAGEGQESVNAEAGAADMRSIAAPAAAAAKPTLVVRESMLSSKLFGREHYNRYGMNLG